MAWYTLFNKTEIKPVEEPQQQNDFKTFSTPLGQIGKGDLTKPYIQSTFANSDAMVRYGYDNLFGQILNQLAVTSGLHGAILRFKALSVYGGGISYEGIDDSALAKVNQKIFLKKNNFNKLIRCLTDDLIIHGRIHVLICKNGKIKRYAPETIRVNEARTKLFYSYNWAYQSQQACWPEWYEGIQEDAIYSYYINSPGGDIYPYVTYQGCLNDVFQLAEIPSLMKDNLQNSIYASYVIKTTGKFKSDEEKEQFGNTVRLLTEPSKRGKVLVFNQPTADALPIVEAMPVNNIPNLFKDVVKDLRESICSSHMINPSIMGIKTSGQLGNTTEIEDSYRIFEKTFVIPTRDEIEEIGNCLLDICGQPYSMILNNFQIIDDQIVNKTDLNPIINNTYSKHILR